MKNFLHIRKMGGSIDLSITDYTGLVYDENCPAGPPLGVPQVVCLTYLSLGVKVGKLRVGQAAQTCGPHPVGGRVVTAYAQYLGIPFLEPAVVQTERGGLVCSPGRKVKNVKGEHHVLLSPVLGEVNLFVIPGSKGKIRGHIPYLCCHVRAFLHRNPVLCIATTPARWKPPSLEDAKLGRRNWPRSARPSYRMGVGDLELSLGVSLDMG